MLKPNQIKQLKEALATAKNPLFFFDDDQDGVCSFITLYKLQEAFLRTSEYVDSAQ